MHCPHDPQLGEVCALEGLQGGDGGFKAYLSVGDRGRSLACPRPTGDKLGR